MIGKKSKKLLEITDDRTFLFHSLLKNLIIFSFALVVFKIVIDILYSTAVYTIIFPPLQSLIAHSVFWMQSLLGMDVVLEGTTLLYNGFSVIVSGDCVGLRQALFFVVLLAGFYQVDLKRRAQGLWFVAVILFLNIFRIFLLYPLFLLIGAEKTIAFHDFLFGYGQAIIVFVLFIFWYYYFVERTCPEHLKAQQQRIKRRKTD